MEVTLVARQSDGLILCESWDTQNIPRSTKRQAKEIIKRLNKPSSPTRCTIDCSDEICFHYLVDNGIIFMTLGKKSYSKKVVFVFLEEIATAFRQELQMTFGTRSLDYRSLIETIEKAYYFIHFDRVIQSKKKAFENPASSGALQKLNQSLMDVTCIMRQNVADILDRGENLESVGRKANELKLTSSRFANNARYLNLKAAAEKYIIIIIIILALLAFFYLRYII